MLPVLLWQNIGFIADAETRIVGCFELVRSVTDARDLARFADDRYGSFADIGDIGAPCPLCSGKRT